MRRGALLVVLVACGGSDPVMPDAPPDAAPRCDANAPFQTPIPVPGLNTELDDVSARLTPDELFVVFSRRRTTGVYDLFSASRSARDAAFEMPSLLATVNSVNSDVWPAISPDGLLLVFDSNRGTGVFHIHVSRRDNLTDPFGTAVAAPALVDNELHPMLANARALYFSSATRAGGQGMRDIFRAEIDSTGATSMPTAVLGGVNTPDEEVTPALTADELRVYFRRTVAGEPDIYTASRSTPQDGFGPASAVPGLAEVGVNEVPTWASGDGCALYFHSDVDGGAGGADLYVALRGAP